MKNSLFSIIVISILFFCPKNGQTQDFTATPICTSNQLQTEFVKHFQKDEPTISPAFNISVPGAAGGMPITWSYQTSPISDDCAAPTIRTDGQFIDFGGNLRATFRNGAAKRVEITATGPLLEGSHVIKIKLRYGSQDRVKKFRFVVRKPVDLVFVLDRSGSMECDVDEAVSANWDGCTTSDVDGNAASADTRRWDILKESIDKFILKLDNNQVLSLDQIGVVYFAGNTTVSGGLSSLAGVANYKDPIIAMHTNFFQQMSASPVEEVIAPKLARDGTSIGEGIYTAIQNRFMGAVNANRRQIILLFTDGEQNTGKWVVETGADAGKIITQEQTSATVELDLKNTGSFAGIEIHTAAVLVYAPGTIPLLETMAENNTIANPTYHNVLPGGEEAFGSNLAGNAFNQIFSTSSPQFVRFEDLTPTPGVPFQFQFTCNRQVNRVILDAYFDAPVGARCQYKIEKDGIDVTQYAQRFVGRHISTFIFNMYDLPDLVSEGNWKITIQEDGKTKLKVRICGTADDHNIEISGKLAENRHHVGEKFNARLSLSENNTPIKDAEVKAIILKPGDDIGDILARTEMANAPQSSTESGTCGGVKYDWIAANKPLAFDRLKQIQRDIITLKHDGNGIYTGNYDDVDVSGTYKIVYWAKAANTQSGYVERMIEQTVNVRPGEIDFSLFASKTSVNQDPPSPTYNHNLVLTPAYTDPNGKIRYVGPGYENAISISGSSLSYSNINDNCDGTYGVSFGSSKKNPKVDIFLTDEKVYSGPIKGLSEPLSDYPFGVSLHAGSTRPFGELDTLFNPGFFLEADLSWQFGSRFGLELVGGHYNFKDNFYINGGTAYLKATINRGGNVFATFAAGPGIYKPKNENENFGWSAKIGMQSPIKKRLIVSLDAGLFNIPDLKYTFGTIGLGLKYRF